MLADAGIQTLEIARPSGQFDAECIREAFRAFRSANCTIAHFHCVHTSPIIAAALARVPVRIWSNHSSTYGDDGVLPKGYKKFAMSTRLTCYLAHAVLPVSVNIRDELSALGVSTGRMSLAPVPVDIERYSSADPSGVRAEFGFDDDDLVIVSVGKAIYRKGWDILLDALRLVHQKRQNVKLLLVGSTDDGVSPLPFFGALERQIEDLNLHRIVWFAGVRHDVPRILAACDIFAFASRAEGLPGALIEAMAAGLPCVATAVDGAKEVIANGANGFLTASDDPKELAERILELAANRSLRIGLGAAGADSLERFTLGYQTKRVIELYERLLVSRTGMCRDESGH